MSLREVFKSGRLANPAGMLGLLALGAGMAVNDEVDSTGERYAMTMLVMWLAYGFGKHMGKENRNDG